MDRVPFSVSGSLVFELPATSLSLSIPLSSDLRNIPGTRILLRTPPQQGMVTNTKTYKLRSQGDGHTTYSPQWTETPSASWINTEVDQECGGGDSW